MHKIISYSIEDTKKFAERVLKTVFENVANKGARSRAVLLILKGDLGSGKTTFTKCMGEILGIKEHITSPTFTIEKRYNITNNSEEFCGVETLIHIDAFRLESGKEIVSLGFEDELKDPKNLICFEWPEMVEDVNILPQDSNVVEFSFVDENTREMCFYEAK